MHELAGTKRTLGIDRMLSTQHSGFKHYNPIVVAPRYTVEEPLGAHNMSEKKFILSWSTSHKDNAKSRCISETTVIYLSWQRWTSRDLVALVYYTVDSIAILHAWK